MKPVTQLHDETARLTEMLDSYSLTSFNLAKSSKLIRFVAIFPLTIFFLLKANDAFAQQKPALPSGQTKGASKRTTINFEDQLVEGQAQKPELFYLLQQRNNNFKRLIRLRENFIPEMRKTSEDVGRPGGSKGS